MVERECGMCHVASGQREDELYFRGVVAWERRRVYVSHIRNYANKKLIKVIGPHMDRLRNMSRRGSSPISLSSRPQSQPLRMVLFSRPLSHMLLSFSSYHFLFHNFQIIPIKFDEINHYISFS